MQHYQVEPEVAVREFLKTADHHERMAELLAQHGKHADAASARDAARRCRANAERIQYDPETGMACLP